MTTRDAIQSYFESLRAKSGWEVLLAEDMTFTSLVSPIKRVTGKGAYLEATKRFFSMIKAVEIRSIIVEGERACALTRSTFRFREVLRSRAMSPKCLKCAMARSSRSTSTLTAPHSPNREAFPTRPATSSTLCRVVAPTTETDEAHPSVTCEHHQGAQAHPAAHSSHERPAAQRD